MKKHLTAPLSTLFFTASLLGLSSYSLASELSFAHPKTAYIGVDATYNTIKSGGLEYNPLSAKLRVGMCFLTNVSLEATFSSGIESDTMSDGAEIDLDSKMGLFMRFQSPIQQGIRVYLFGGYNTLTISQTSLTGESVEEDYDSVAWGIGLEEHFKVLKKVIFFAEYGRPYDDEFRLSYYSLGARYQF
ncbi:MAG: outer membrane beta-barrel protein [Pseudomonadales bacterium]|nr:outer membrane beta-barrel protein [Pseudomonadales bacterium]